MRPQDPFIGRDILDGQFQILQKIGSGGMGAVYKALQPSMNRMVGIKILHPKLTNRKDLVSRFRREARAMSHLSHPNTVKVFLYGELDDGSLYIVMEFLDGKNLNQTVRAEGPFPVERGLPILIQACGALDEAHKLGIIHRDLKPENIFLCQQAGMKDYPKVLDFGLAKVTEREMRPGSIILTQEGMVFGTPEFMSPEQAQGKVLTPGSDIYSLAVILYEVLTTKLPFEAKTAMDYIQAHVNVPPIPLAERAGKPFPPLLWPVLSRALAKNPEERFASASDFALAMQAVLDGATELPSTLAPPKPVVPEPTPEPIVPKAKRGSAKSASGATPRAQKVRDEMSTKPDRGKRELAVATQERSPERQAPSAKERMAKPARTGPPVMLLIGVAAGCLILGVLLTVVVMKVLGH
jgi:serine/threonine-protein kinase